MIDIVPYADVPTGNSYFSTKLQTEFWDEAYDDVRLKALKEATRRIDRLNFSGIKTDPSQDKEFPRNGDIDVPDGIIIATMEIAYTLLDPTLDMEMEVEDLGVSNNAFASIRFHRDPFYYVVHMRAGIPSALAWSYLRPFLVDPTMIQLIRA